MRKFFIVLFLCVLSTVAFGADDCVESPYDGKTYCCNVREKNLPDGAINKSWAEVIPWDKYYGTVRKCVGGRMTNDQFGDEIDGVAPNLRGAKIRKEASEYKVAYYKSFDGTYWEHPICLYGFSYLEDTTGGCTFRGLKRGWGNTRNSLYVCGKNRFPENVYDYVRLVTGNELVFMDFYEVVRIDDLDWAGFIYRCIPYDTGYWEVIPFCTSADVPTDAELQSGVLDHLDEGWLMVTDMGDKVSLQGYKWGYEHEGYREEYNYLECWTRGTAEDAQTKETQKKYNYKSCSSDSDCTGIDNKKRPYLHSTAWKCIEQTAGVRVCAAKECETGWEPKNGYCQEKNSGPAAATSRSAGAKNCPDANMDANCKCTVVPETLERNGLCVCKDSNKEIKNGKCEFSDNYLAQIHVQIDASFNKLNGLTANFEKNVWRDADGNFNTARLASDSIAGVVLGTAGGLITNKIVKKNQLKTGFEDITCYIGGQVVSGFGDDFSAGR